MTELLSETLDAYLNAALWSSVDDDGEPLDDNYSIRDFDRNSLRDLEKEYKDFYRKFGGELEALGGDALERAGYDLWLTQNGHGAGFWDRDDDAYGADLRDRMDKYAQRAGNIDLYVGDDGKIYT